jgi:RimJ/RimL family protein N-acetyltransferase
MTEKEFKKFYDNHVIDYARDNVEAGYWSEVESNEKASTKIDKLLPKGKNILSHHFFSIFEQDIQENIGVLWLEIQESALKKSAFIFYIMAFEKFRGMGYGKKCLQVTEE